MTAALLHRERSGEGQFVGVSLLRSALAMQSARFVWADGEGRDVGRDMRSGGITGLHPTKQGSLYVSANTPHFWRALCERLAVPELAADPRFDTVRKRAEHADELVPRIRTALQSRTALEWEQVFGEQVPCAAAREIEDMVRPPAGDGGRHGDELRASACRPLSWPCRGRSLSARHRDLRRSRRRRSDSTRRRCWWRVGMSLMRWTGFGDLGSSHRITLRKGQGSALDPPSQRPWTAFVRSDRADATGTLQMHEVDRFAVFCILDCRRDPGEDRSRYFLFRQVLIAEFMVRAAWQDRTAPHLRLLAQYDAAERRQIETDP